MNTHQAINKSHQSKVTRLIAWEYKLSAAVNAVNERAENVAFNKIHELHAALPKREVAAVDKYLLKVRGY